MLQLCWMKFQKFWSQALHAYLQYACCFRPMKADLCCPFAWSKTVTSERFPVMRHLRLQGVCLQIRLKVRGPVSCPGIQTLRSVHSQASRISHWHHFLCMLSCECCILMLQWRWPALVGEVLSLLANGLRLLKIRPANLILLKYETKFLLTEWSQLYPEETCLWPWGLYLMLEKNLFI